MTGDLKNYNLIMPGVRKMVKDTLKILQQMLQDFNLCLNILWKPGITGLKIFVGDTDGDLVLLHKEHWTVSDG